MQKTIFTSIAYLLLVVAVLQPQYGGEIVVIPTAWFAWIPAAVVIFAGLYLVLKKGEMVVPYLIPVIGFYILLCVIAALFAPQFNPFVLWEWGGFVVGALFFWALHQQSWSNKWQQNFLLLLLIAGVIQAIIGIAQFFGLKIFGYSFYHSGVALGGFYQKNVLASFLVTAIMSIMLIQKLPNQKALQLTMLQILIGLALVLMALVVQIAASFMGFLALVMGSAVIITAYAMPFFNDKKHMKPMLNPYIWLVCIVVGYFLLPQILQISPFEGVSKFSYHTNSTSNHRYAMYAAAFKLFTLEPFFGNGMGTMAGIFRPYYAEKMYAFGNPGLMNYTITHPHNEVLYRMVESGLFGLLGMLAMMGLILWVLWKVGGQKAWLYIAVLLPFAFHSMTELPFYHSAVSWIIFIILLYLPNHAFTKTYRFNSKIIVQKFAIVILPILAVAVGIFAVDKFQTYQHVKLAFYKTRPPNTLSIDTVEKLLGSSLNDGYYGFIAKRKLVAEQVLRAVRNNDQAILKKYSQAISENYKFILTPPVEHLKILMLMTGQSFKYAHQQYQFVKRHYPLYQMPYLDTNLWQKTISDALEHGRNLESFPKFEQWLLKKQTHTKLSEQTYDLWLFVAKHQKNDKKMWSIYQEFKRFYPDSQKLAKWKIQES